jgi:predicted helicase
MMIYSKNYNTMIEVKNYTNKLPKKEIDKFLNDMETTNSDSGIVFSSSAMARKNSIDFELIKNNIPIFYIHTNPK